MDGAPNWTRVLSERLLKLIATLRVPEKKQNRDYHSLPTGLRKAKAFLEDEYLHDIQTAQATIIKGIFITKRSAFIASK